MSGQALRALLLGDGGWDQSLLQCHQPSIGAPSPIQANHPWYPTVILPTTSPAGLPAAAALAELVAAAGRAVSSPAGRPGRRRPRPTAAPAASAAPDTAEVRNLRRESATIPCLPAPREASPQTLLPPHPPQPAKRAKGPQPLRT